MEAALFWINAVLIWIVANGTAFMGDSPPLLWRRANAPEWDTDANGTFRLYCTWLATIMDAGLIIWIIALMRRH